MSNVGPCGRVKDHERNQPDRTPVGGGHGREDARARTERAKVEPRSQTIGYRPWNHTLKVIITPRGVERARGRGSVSAPNWI